MRRTLLLSAVLTAGFVGAVPLAAMASTSSSTPSVLTCAGKKAIKPTSYVIACADGNSELTSIKWTSWGTNTATGTATFHTNTCTPNCVAGKFVDYKATVTFSKPTKASSGLLFSKISYTYAKPTTTSQSLPLTALGQGGGGA
jgi:hypothetical protein